MSRMAGWSAGSGSCWCGRLVWCAEQGALRTTGQTENKTKQNFDGNGQMNGTQGRATANCEFKNNLDMIRLEGKSCGAPLWRAADTPGDNAGAAAEPPHTGPRS